MTPARISPRLAQSQLAQSERDPSGVNEPRVAGVSLLPADPATAGTTGSQPHRARRSRRPGSRGTVPALASPTLLPSSTGALAPVECQGGEASARRETHDTSGSSHPVEKVDVTKGCVGAGKIDEQVWGSVALSQGLDGLADTAHPYSSSSHGFTQHWGPLGPIGGSLRRIAGRKGRSKPATPYTAP